MINTTWKFCLGSNFKRKVEVICDQKSQKKDHILIVFNSQQIIGQNEVLQHWPWRCVKSTCESRIFNQIPEMKQRLIDFLDWLTSLSGFQRNYQIQPLTLINGNGEFNVRLVSSYDTQFRHGENDAKNSSKFPDIFVKFCLDRVFISVETLFSNCQKVEFWRDSRGTCEKTLMWEVWGVWAVNEKRTNWFRPTVTWRETSDSTKTFFKLFNSLVKKKGWYKPNFRYRSRLVKILRNSEYFR